MKYILMLAGDLNGFRFNGTKILDIQPSQLSDIEAIDKGRELAQGISWVSWAAVDIFEEGSKVRTIVIKVE